MFDARQAWHGNDGAAWSFATLAMPSNRDIVWRVEPGRRGCRESERRSETKLNSDYVAVLLVGVVWACLYAPSVSGNGG